MWLRLHHASVMDVLRNGQHRDVEMHCRCVLRAGLLDDLQDSRKLTLMHVLDLLDYMHLAGHSFRTEWTVAKSGQWHDVSLLTSEAARTYAAIPDIVLYIRLVPTPPTSAPRM